MKKCLKTTQQKDLELLHWKLWHLNKTCSKVKESTKDSIFVAVFSNFLKKFEDLNLLTWPHIDINLNQRWMGFISFLLTALIVESTFWNPIELFIFICFLKILVWCLLLLSLLSYSKMTTRDLWIASLEYADGFIYLFWIRVHTSNLLEQTYKAKPTTSREEMKACFW